jgi:hypothetical protein
MNNALANVERGAWSVERKSSGRRRSSHAPTLPRSTPKRSSEAGFTLAEVLAALLFMAIVVPVAIEGLHIASLAGTVAQRKGEASRVAQGILNESLVTTNWTQGYLAGTWIDGQRQFPWTLRCDPWTLDINQSQMRQLTVKVDYTAQNRSYSVSLSTLVDGSLGNTNAF